MNTCKIIQLGENLVCKVPYIKEDSLRETLTHNILLCDSSGSMGSYWKNVATEWNNLVSTLEGTVSIILFDNKTYKLNGKNLPLIQPYRGGTNIIKGLEELSNELIKYLNYDTIRIFFITDGSDTDNTFFEDKFNETISKIKKPFNTCEFYILGISNYFPVFISQNIRNKLHSGRSSIPNLFWAQNGSEDIKDEFKIITENSKNILKIIFNTGGKKTPFSNIENIFYVGDYILLSKDNINSSTILFEVNNQPFYAEITYESSHKIILEIFQQWVGILQSKAINDEIIEDAKLLKTVMENIWINFINNFKPQIQKMKTFSERLLNKELKTYQYSYQSLLKIVNDLSSGLKLKFMNNIDLAKQLKGVYTSKYSEKNFKLREHTDEDFIKDKNNFIEILLTIKDKLKDVECDDRCLISLDNTLEIIRSDDFIDSLKQCDNKIDFLKNIGITGSGVLLNLTDAATINPWVTQIKNVGKMCPTLSTTALEDLIENSEYNNEIELTSDEKEKHIVAIKTGSGSYEKLNSIIPLFNEELSVLLKPIINTNIFQLICTYSIMKSPMTLNYNAHLGALSGLLGYLLSQSKSEWRNDTILKIRHTARVYMERPLIKKFIETLWVNPARAVITEIPDEDIKCESITKILLMILISAKDKSPEEIESVMIHMWKEYIGRTISSNNQINLWFKLINEEQFSSNIIFPDFSEIYEYGYSISEVKKNIEKKIRNYKLDRPNIIDITLDFEKLESLWNGGNVGNISLKGLKVFTNSLGYNITDEQIFQFVTHSIKYNGSFDRMNEIDTYENSKDYIINNLLGLKIKNVIEQKIKEYQKLSEKEYFNNYDVQHETLLPMTMEDIINEANKLNINVTIENFNEIYDWNDNNNLICNACMFKECKYFLIPRKDFNCHIERLQSKEDFIHAYHKTINKNRKSDINKIINYISEGKETRGDLTYNKKIVLKKYDDIELNRDIYFALYG